MDLKTLMYLREANHVKRYHTVAYTAIEDTVGHHTNNVVGLLFFLFDDAPPLGVISNALYHDVLELLTGDIPATAKWTDEQFAAALTKFEDKLAKNLGFPAAKMTDREGYLLKFADIMDLCFKCVDEIMVGNQAYFSVLINGLGFSRHLLKSHLKDHVRAVELFAALMNHPHINIMELVDEPIQQTH
jgi:5'-deoxynucleotidase YfbR-like HD superfamily hydrolase